MLYTDSTAYIDFSYKEEAEYFVEAIHKTPFDSYIIIVQNHPSQYDFILSLFSVNGIPKNFPNIITYYYTYVYLPGFGLACYLVNNIMITANKIKNILHLEKYKLLHLCTFKTPILLIHFLGIFTGFVLWDIFLFPIISTFYDVLIIPLLKT
jgi:hypothetical protein